MTGLSSALPARPHQSSTATVSRADQLTRTSPIVVLTYSHAGTERLQLLLSAHPDLACTASAGLLPLCVHAAATWREAEGRHGQRPSTLAATSIRAMTASMMTTLLARTGKRHWCEFSVAQPSSAQTFLHLYPTARIVCLYRSCPDFIWAAVRASPGGLPGPSSTPFAAADPADTIAILTAFWAARTEALTELEAANPQATHRIRYEDLTALRNETVSDLLSFLGLNPDEIIGPALQPASDDPGTPLTTSFDNGKRLPFSQLPEPLLAQVNNLLAELGYPPMGSGIL